MDHSERRPDTSPAAALWRHAQAVYARHAARLLQAQEQFSADVCLLLYAHWCAQAGVCLTPENWQQLLTETATQRAQISVLRARRRQLKPDTGAASGSATGNASTSATGAKKSTAAQRYAEAKAQELAAEKQLLDALSLRHCPPDKQNAGDAQKKITGMRASSCWQASVQNYAQQIAVDRADVLADLLAPLGKWLEHDPEVVHGASV